MRPTRVLVGEDHTVIRLDLHRLLGSAGYDVCGLAIDGIEAVECAHDLRPDLVLLDVDMPRLDGIEAARRIRAERKVPVVMLTAFGYGELLARGVEAGVHGFVVKPFDEADLLDALSEALRTVPTPDALESVRRG
jgi:response regulator NasT